MSWERLKEMNLYSQLEDHLKSVPEKDSKAVEEIILDKDRLGTIKAYIHDGLDNRSISEEMKVSVDQVDIIKDMLGKL